MDVQFLCSLFCPSHPTSLPVKGTRNQEYSLFTPPGQGSTGPQTLQRHLCVLQLMHTCRKSSKQ